MAFARLPRCRRSCVSLMAAILLSSLRIGDDRVQDRQLTTHALLQFT
jgi:hypothetical protein